MSEFKINPELKKTIPWKLVVIFLCFSAAIILLGINYYKLQQTRIFSEYQNNLSAVASLKIRQIVRWHNERLGNAAVIRDNEPLLKQIKLYLGNENEPRLKTELTKWMKSLYTEYDYSSVALSDTLLKIRLAATVSDSITNEGIRKELSEVIRYQKILMTDLKRSGTLKSIYMDLLVPLIDPESKKPKTFGVIILRIDPEKILFPLIQSWPTPSKSSETLLLRKEEDSVLYINELRHRKNTALILRLPLTNKNLLATKAAIGQNGVFEGMDYRNVPVVGYLSGVPGFPWFMVAKVDREEILSPLRRYIVLILIVIVLLILINASVFGFWIWNQQVKIYRLKLKDELALRESREKLLESEEFFRKLFENMLNGFAYCKMIFTEGQLPDFLYINVNEAFELLTGLKNVIGKKVSEVIPGIQDADPELMERYSRVALTGKPEVFETYVESLKMWFSISVYSPKKEYFVAVFDVITLRKQSEEALREAVNNITDRKNAEAQIKRFNEELEERVILRTEQLQAANKELEAFSYSVSHDLRAPLRSIHGFTKILLEDYEANLDEEGKRICRIISSSASQMGELIDDLLSFSKIGRSGLNPSEIDMKKMVRLVFEGMTSPSEIKSIKLTIGKIHKAFGDVTQLGQVWVNLLSNAIKYSSKNEFSEISVGSTESGGMITYYIKDKGVGFDMQYVHKLFGVFQRLHSEAEFEGNGVGLAIVQRIIHKHGGKVWAEGEVGKGATFYFSLPIKGDGQAAAGNRQTINQTPDARRQTPDT